LVSSQDFCEATVCQLACPIRSPPHANLPNDSHGNEFGKYLNRHIIQEDVKQLEKKQFLTVSNAGIAEWEYENSEPAM